MRRRKTGKIWSMGLISLPYRLTRFRSVPEIGHLMKSLKTEGKKRACEIFRNIPV